MFPGNGINGVLFFRLERCRSGDGDRNVQRPGHDRADPKNIARLRRPFAPRLVRRKRRLGRVPASRPVLLEVVAPGAAATVTLRNNGAKPIATQVRVFRWIQEAGGERLEPTDDVVASPPAVELQPAQDYVARVVRVTKKPVEGEEAYRLFIDELPEAPQGQRTVNLVVRHSIPLFFDAPGSSAPEAAWRVTQNGRAVSLSAANGGDRRLRLAVG